MLEGKLPGVKHESRSGHLLPRGMAVDRIAEDGEAERFLHVDADLVRAAGEQSILNESTALVLAELCPFGDGLLAGTIVEDGHAFAIHRMPADHVLHTAAAFLGHAVDDGEVDFR